MTTKVQRAAMRRLIDTFGAEIVLQQQPQLPRDRRERTGHRLAVDEAIAACTACDLRAGCKSPLTPIYSPARLDRVGRVAVVGEGPSWEEERAGELGHGRAGNVLMSAMRRGGIPAERVAYTTAVACHPSDGPRAGKPPTTQQAVTCSTHLLKALDAADVDYVMLLGAWATRAWRPDVTLERVAGGLYLWNRRWFVYPIQHANAVLREGGLEAKEWHRKVLRFCEIVNDGQGLEALGSSCVKCGDVMYGWDEDGVPWCDKHFDGGAGKARDRVVKIKPKDTNQGAML